MCCLIERAGAYFKEKLVIWAGLFKEKNWSVFLWGGGGGGGGGLSSSLQNIWSLL